MDASELGATAHVLVLDGGAPRNAPAQQAHGFLSRDGFPPLELLRLAREELGAYPNVEIEAGEAARAAATSETTVRGVYAAGDMIGPMQSLVLAAASGARAAAALNRAMALEDAEARLATPGSLVT